jgi:hypothetical protein
MASYLGNNKYSYLNLLCNASGSLLKKDLNYYMFKVRVEEVVVEMRVRWEPTLARYFDGGLL